MSSNETNDTNPEPPLSTEQLDEVSGGGLIEPVITRREGLAILTETFPSGGAPLAPPTGVKIHSPLTTKLG